jgi:hypothetical protein
VRGLAASDREVPGRSSDAEGIFDRTKPIFKIGRNEANFVNRRRLQYNAAAKEAARNRLILLGEFG